MTFSAHGGTYLVRPVTGAGTGTDGDISYGLGAENWQRGIYREPPGQSCLDFHAACTEH